MIREPRTLIRHNRITDTVADVEAILSEVLKSLKKFLRCSLSHSFVNTSLKELLSIKGLGEKALEEVMANRPFHSIEDLIFNEKIVYRKLNKKAVAVLAKSGALKALQDSRFRGDRHFLHCLTEGKPKAVKGFQAAIDKYDGPDSFTREERVIAIHELTGRFPIDSVVKSSDFTRLSRHGIMQISELEGEGVAWGVVREIEFKQTRGKSSKWILATVEDFSGISTQVRCWAITPNCHLEKYKMYMIKASWSADWGFSTRGLVDKSWVEIK